MRRSNEDRRLIESIRAVLAIVAGLLMLDTPSSIQNNLSIGVLAFGAYACGLLWFAANGSRFPMLRILHWIDACWFLLFIALSQEIGVRYFLFLFFPVLFASWRRGFGESTSVAVFSGLSAMCLFGLLTPEISWTRLLALPLSLLIIGPLVAVLTRVEATTQQGFTFAARLVDSIDPQRGFETIMPPILEHIAREFGATAALLVIRSFEGGNRVLCWEESEACSELSESAATPLAERILAFPSEQAFAFRTSSRWWRRENVQAFAVYGSHLEPVQPDHAAIRSLADLLEHPTLMSVPLPCRSIGSLRLVLSGAKVGAKPQELDILIHIIEQLGPTIEKAFLLERLASEAVDTERARIGRDLHDSAIQPYIGLKFAIEALARQAGSENPITQDLERLLAITTDELKAMREVVSGLRGAPGKGGVLLANAVQRQAARFSQLFGITVRVDIDGSLPVSRRIAGELFHIVAEGLSNIRRHTQSHRAAITLSCDDEILTLKIRNEHAPNSTPAKFQPRSLSERATALGGCSLVESDTAGTTVIIEIPLDEPAKGKSA